MPIDRRDLLRTSAAAALLAGLPHMRRAAAQGPNNGAPDYTLRIGTGLVELAPDRIVSTTTYNGQFPGPLIRLTEGRRVVVDIHNDTDTPEQLHWHGLGLPAEVDGAAEAGTPFVPARGMRRISLTPKPAGFRFYQSAVAARSDLSKGAYSGQAGPLYVEPKDDPGNYDRKVFVVLKEFQPSFRRGGSMPHDFLAPGARVRQLESAGEAALKASLGRGAPRGFEVGYSLFAINGRMLGHGEPIKANAGERLLLHVVNASASEIRSLALPGHAFTVVALDGNPVATPAEVPVLWLGAGERVSAIVEMKHPGVWVLGDLSDDERGRGMGIVVEYAGQSGKPRWTAPGPFKWDYTRFGKPQRNPALPDETFELTFAKNNAAYDGFNEWTVNGAPFSLDKAEPRFRVHAGRRYRLRLRNASKEVHPLHLHRHSFELTRIAGRATGGIVKDTVMLGGYQEVEVDFTADNPGRTLLRCQHQLRADFGFMALFDYV
jgi:FtsP/CotA-like multicopper oxidase with cupredoxin domain